MSSPPLLVRTPSGGRADRDRGKQLHNLVCSSFAPDEDELRRLCAPPVDRYVLEYKDQRGWTPLHRAASLGHRTAVEVLLQHGANPSAITMREQTPLDVVLLQRGKPIFNQDIVDVLQRCVTDPDYLEAMRTTRRKKKKKPKKPEESSSGGRGDSMSGQAAGESKGPGTVAGGGTSSGTSGVSGGGAAGSGSGNNPSSSPSSLATATSAAAAAAASTPAAWRFIRPFFNF